MNIIKLSAAVVDIIEYKHKTLRIKNLIINNYLYTCI